MVQQGLLALMKNRTTFVIAHRLTTIMHAHRIIMLEQGKIIEEGTHEELMSKKGKYSTLFKLQFQKNLL